MWLSNHFPINCLVNTMPLDATEIFKFIVLNLMRAMAEFFSNLVDCLHAQCLYPYIYFTYFIERDAFCTANNCIVDFFKICPLIPYFP